MNSHLELLLSRAYDGALAAEHRADLEKSALGQDIIAEQFIRSIPPNLIPKLLGFDIPAIRSAMLLPFRAAAGGFMPHVRMKIFPTLTDAEGHSVKYLQPKGAGPRLYFVARTLRTALEGDAPLWLVEGEKKALAVAQCGYPAVGFCGVEGWHARHSRALIGDFDTIRLRDRIVEVLPDGDYRTNEHVKRAVQRLGTALADRGARPRVVLLPQELPQ